MTPLVTARAGRAVVSVRQHDPFLPSSMTTPLPSTPADDRSLTVDHPPGGDGGHDPNDPPPAPALPTHEVLASGDGGNQGGGTEQDPGGDGGHGPADPPPAASLLGVVASGDGGTSGVGTDQDPEGPSTPPGVLHDITTG